MKKWLGESSSLCLPKNRQISEEKTCGQDASASNSTLGNESDANNYSENSTPSTTTIIDKFKMGLGVSSEQLPSSTSSDQTEMAHVPTSTASSTCKSTGEIPVSLCHRSVAFITSVNRRIQVSSPCHHFSPQNVSVQLHDSRPMCSTSGLQDASIPNIMPRISSQNAAASSPEQLNQLPQVNEDNIYHNLSDRVSGNSQNTGASNVVPTDIHGLAISLPSLYPSRNNVCHVHCVSDSAKPSFSQAQTHSSSYRENIHGNSLERIESEPDTANSSLCGARKEPGHNHTTLSSQVEYESSLQATNCKNIHSHSLCHSKDSKGNETTHSKNETSASSGCGHWCSTCRVRVQVEVECVPGSQRSPNGNRRGIRTLSFPKKVRYKVKAPTKEFNGAHKKKKSPWSFRFNCRLRANKNDSEPESSSTGISALNMGCVSCVCPGYRRSDTEPVYRSVIENTNSTNNLATQASMVDFSRLNTENLPVTDDENLHQERTREVAEGANSSSGFIPLLRDNSNSLPLPLTYNSVLGLQVLLENSLRLGLGGTRTGWISYPGESLLRQIGPLTSESSLLTRTVHTQVDYIHCLVPDLLAITNCGFYWGKMDRYEAEELLENRPEGTFLLRDSAQEEYLFSVSFRRYGRSLHARIEQWNHKFSFDSHDSNVFASHTVCGLIEHYKDPSCCMFFEPLLTNPMARTFPFHLQHLCRATICSRTTYDGINYLELPKSLKNYLKEYHYKQRVGIRYLD